jgi:Domain of unknown function (DUF1942)
VKFTTITTALASAATAGAVGIVSAPMASAEDTTTSTIGSQAKLLDGNVIQGWTISNLKTSSDQIPYPVNGTLWEATATDEAIQGSAIPIVSNLNARSKSGETYRALFGAATPEGVNPATLAQGQKTSGKVYFDVTGDTPDTVVYNAGGEDLLTWVQPAPSARQATPYPSRSYTTPSPAASQVTPAPAATSGTPAPAGAAEATPAPAGSQGTPLPPGAQDAPASAAASEGTPAPAGSQGTPLPPGAPVTPAPAGTEGAPIPASVQGAPAPAGSQGTPLPAGSPASPVAPTTTPVPAPLA